MVVSTVHSKFHAPTSAARRCSEQGLNPVSLVQLSPFSRRRRTSLVDADAGAEQWYKTIAKLMQGRNSNSTQTSEPRAGAPLGAPALHE